MEEISAFNFGSMEMISQEDNPKVSIITPSLNKAAFVEKTIKSVLEQDYVNIEHIVIDGGSTDGTLEILRKFNHLKLISEPDNGQSQAINKGFRMASGSILTWLNADDMLLPFAVSKIVEAFKNYPQAAFIYGDFWVLDEYSKEIILVKTIDYDRNILIYGCNLINQPASFFRKEIFDSTGWLDEELHYCMDYDLWVRCALKGMKFVNIRQPLAAIHLCKDTKTMDHPEMVFEAIRQVLNRNNLLWFSNYNFINKSIFYLMFFLYKIKCLFKRLLQRKEFRMVSSTGLAAKKMKLIERGKQR